MDDFDAPPPKSQWTDSTKTTLGVLIALVVVLIAAGIGIATIRDARDTVENAISTTTTVAPAAGGSTVPDTTPASELTPAQSRIVEEMKVQVASIRGLAWKGSLPVKVVSKEALAQRVRALNAEEIAENRDEITADESVLKLLKLLEEGRRLRQDDRLDPRRRRAGLLRRRGQGTLRGRRRRQPRPRHQGHARP